MIVSALKYYILYCIKDFSFGAMSTHSYVLFSVTSVCIYGSTFYLSRDWVSAFTSLNWMSEIDSLYVPS